MFERVYSAAAQPSDANRAHDEGMFAHYATSRDGSTGRLVAGMTPATDTGIRELPCRRGLMALFTKDTIDRVREAGTWSKLVGRDDCGGWARAGRDVPFPTRARPRLRQQEDKAY